jgi:hypothetical protein
LADTLLRRCSPPDTNRGITPNELPARVERLLGERDSGSAGLNSLRGRRWDVCVDVSGYAPRQVRPSAEALDANVNRNVFVSAVSMYGDPNGVPVTESYPRIAPASEDITEVNADTYGALNVACETLSSRSTAIGARFCVRRLSPGHMTNVTDFPIGHDAQFRAAKCWRPATDPITRSGPVHGSGN